MSGSIPEQNGNQDREGLVFHCQLLQVFSYPSETKQGSYKPNKPSYTQTKIPQATKENGISTFLSLSVKLIMDRRLVLCTHSVHETETNLQHHQCTPLFPPCADI